MTVAVQSPVDRACGWLEGPRGQRLVTVLIVLNAVILGLETSSAIMQAAGPLLRLVDGVILAFFVAEIAVRIAGRGRAFFKDPWSLFDFAVVAIALVPAQAGLGVLRALRVLRVLRLITVVPRLRQVVYALLASLPGLGAIVALLGLVFYVFSVIATNLFGADFDEWFGTLGRSVYTLFQVMTLESWSMGIVRPVMEVYPWAWAFFVPFILMATFTMLNLFIAIIVNAMQSTQMAEIQEAEAAIQEASRADSERLLEELKLMRAELAEVKGILARQTPPAE